MDMRSFFGDSPIRLVAYEIPYSVIQQFPANHPQRFINYVFNVVLTPLDPDDDVVDAHLGEYDADAAKASSHESPKSPSNSAVESSAGGDEDDSNDEEGDVEEDGEDDEFSFRETISPVGKKKKSILSTGRESISGGGSGSGSGGGITSWFQRKIHDLPDVIEIPETSGEFSIPDFESEAVKDLRHCPATIEVFDRKKEGRTACVMFLLPYAINPSLTSREHLSARLRTYAEIRSKFDMQPIPKLHKNKKMSLNEKRRRQIVESYKAILTKATSASTSAINALLQFESDNDRNFLSMNLMRKREKMVEDSVWEGNVALALSCRYWVESFLVITPTEATFYKFQNTRQIRLHFPVESIVRAKQMRSEDCPFEGGYAFLKLETLARVLYVVVKNEGVLVDLKTALAKVGVTADATVHMVDNDDAFPYHLDRPPTWKLDKKMLYNCRTIIFSTSGIPQHLRSRGPCELVEILLAKALNLSTLWNSRGNTAPGKRHELIKLWVDFLDELSVLQVLDIASLSEFERAALFLNLFHIMVIHGSLVLGPPQSRGSWQPFFNEVAYLVSFDVVSIAELEHNILRAAMSRPPLLNQTTARIPRSHFPGLALTQRDFRFNFCINHGSISMPRQIRIFRTETLDDQLDEVRT